MFDNILRRFCSRITPSQVVLSIRWSGSRLGDVFHLDISVFNNPSFAALVLRRHGSTSWAGDTLSVLPRDTGRVIILAVLIQHHSTGRGVPNQSLVRCLGQICPSGAIVAAVGMFLNQVIL